MILTLKELADYLRVHERTILRMLKAGQLQGVKIGGQWRFNGSQIDQVFFPEKPVTSPDAVLLSDLTANRPPSPLSRLVKDDRILLDLTATDVTGALHELSEPFAQKTLLLDIQDMRNRLESREKLLSTGIGRGIAIPHPRDPIPTLREPAVIIIGRSTKGVAFKAIDGKPVYLFFMLCCQNIELHLHFMGSLAKLLQEPEFVEACRNAKTPAEITRPLMETEARQLLKGGPPAASL